MPETPGHELITLLTSSLVSMQPFISLSWLWRHYSNSSLSKTRLSFSWDCTARIFQTPVCLNSPVNTHPPNALITTSRCVFFRKISEISHLHSPHGTVFPLLIKMWFAVCCFQLQHLRYCAASNPRRMLPAWRITVSHWIAVKQSLVLPAFLPFLLYDVWDIKHSQAMSWWIGWSSVPPMITKISSTVSFFSKTFLDRRISHSWALRPEFLRTSCHLLSPLFCAWIYRYQTVFSWSHHPEPLLGG